MALNLPKGFSLKKHLTIEVATTLTVVFVIVLALVYSFYTGKVADLNTKVASLLSQDSGVRVKLASIEKELDELKKEDQVVKNKKLEEDIKNIETTYKKAVKVYEDLLDLKDKNAKVPKLDEQLALSLKQLSDRNYASASGTLDDLTKKIKDENDKIAAAFKVPTNIPAVTANTPATNTVPDSGYRRQSVQAPAGTFMVDIVAADLNSTRVIVDTASDSDCANNCPVLSLGDYVSRSGAFAGINGSYFCPSTYPSCANKTNSFDTLLMNKNKKYFNSDNNVYSTVPAVIFSGSSARFISKSLEWGRDTGVDAVLANYPLLVHGGQNAVGSSSDEKLTSRGPRGFVGAKGSKVFIGVVHNTTVAMSAEVLQTLGIENALNLDSGGSTALWSGGYKVGPGRQIPNAILFVGK